MRLLPLEEVALALGLGGLGPGGAGSFIDEKVCHVDVEVVDDSTVALFVEHSDGFAMFERKFNLLQLTKLERFKYSYNC